MFAIVTKSRRSSVPLDILFEFFNRVALPVVLYASEVCGHNDYATISSIKKLRKIIHFEIFIDWCAILYTLIIYITDIIQRTMFMSQNCV